MGAGVWQVPQEQFEAVWNGAASLDEASARVREIVSGIAPGWALLQRAMELRRAGVEMKPLVRTVPLHA